MSKINIYQLPENTQVFVIDKEANQVRGPYYPNYSLLGTFRLRESGSSKTIHAGSNSWIRLSWKDACLALAQSYRADAEMSLYRAAQWERQAEELPLKSSNERMESK